jgi:hypothetical protein
MPRARPAPPHGSTLLLTIILLLFVTVIGIAAVKLSAQDRVNAASKQRRDEMMACANAARLQLWAEIARQGPAYLRSDAAAGQIVLADGTELRAPARSSAEGADGTPIAELVELVPVVTQTGQVQRDQTNGMARPRADKRGGDGNGNRLLARCKDAKGRELFVEFTTKFAIF